MAANSHFAGAVQVLCFLAYVGDRTANAERIARSMDTNPVVVRRLLKLLETRGLVAIRQGRNGGVTLERAPEEITLRDVHDALDEATMFALRERGNPRCPVNRAMKSVLDPVFGDVESAVGDALGRTRLSDLVAQVRAAGRHEVATATAAAASE